ncbi:MAG: hypothetical protein QW156_02240 [Candidatus Aenigmatarchaeota archaeon]
MIFMLQKDVEEEIEKLKSKKMELVNKINLTLDFEERDNLEKEVEKIEEQIQLLEKMKTSKV